MIYNNYVEVFKALQDKYKKGQIEDGLVELIDVCFPIEHDVEYVDLSIKPCDRKYIEQEIKWYLEAKPNINTNLTIANTKIWKKVAADDGSVNSNYGYRILSDKNGEQFLAAIDALIRNKYSKQAVMYYAFPMIHKYKDDNIHAKSDMICTTHVQLLIRDNKLSYYVFMRSNDAFYGFQNDYSWHRYVHDCAYLILKDKYAELEFGPIVWHATSFHVYERHFKLLEGNIYGYVPLH